MPLPTPASFFRRRKDTNTNTNTDQNNHEDQQDRQLDRDNENEGDQNHQESSSHSPTARPKGTVWRDRILRSLIYLIAFIFILLVQIGSTSDKPVLRDSFFLKIDLSDIIPRSVPDAVLINSIARSIGLHDFYQVGLWNFCEGYEDGTGITYCSPAQTLYFFNPIEILLSELLAGATIALPSDITMALDIARVASHWMFAFFLVSIILIFLCLVLTPFSVPSTTSTTHQSTPGPTTKKSTFKSPISKLIAFPLAVLSFAAFFTALAGAAVATAMFTIFKFVFTNAAEDLNVGAELGTQMLVFTWIGVGATLVGFVVHCYELCSCCCCCCSRRQKRRRAFKGHRFFAEKPPPAGAEMQEREAEKRSHATGGKHSLWQRLRFTK